MKKFIMVVPLQLVERAKKDVVSGRIVIDNVSGKPVMEPVDMPKKGKYQPVGNPRLAYDKFDGMTRFPIIPVINAYAQNGDTIEVIAINTHTPSSEVHFAQLEEETAALAREKNFDCKVTDVPVNYAGDVSTVVQVFRKLLDYLNDGDILYACFTYGVKPMPIAELMALQYAYRVKKNVSIGCLVYGEMDHSAEPQQLRIFDITALIHLDETIRLLSERGVEDPLPIIDSIISAADDAYEDEDYDQ